MSVSSFTTPQSVAAAIEAARRDSTDEETRNAAEVVEVNHEITKLGLAIDNLIQQREALQEFRSRLTADGAELRAKTMRLAHEALYETLEAQAEALLARAAAMTEAQPDRLAAPPDALVQDLVDAIRSPETEVDGPAARERLAALLREHTEPRPLDVESLSIDVVYAVDAPDGTPELLVVLVPVRASVNHPRTASDGLPLWLTARIGHALFSTARSLALGHIDVRSGPALGHDLLDIEVELSGAPRGFVASFATRLGTDLARAPELAAAKLVVRPTELPAEFVFPPSPDPEPPEASEPEDG